MKTFVLLVLAAAFAASAQTFGWYEMAHVPMEPSVCGCEDGAWLAAMEREGQEFVYAAKGGGVGDFCRYDVEADTWLQLEAIPRGREGQLPEDGCRGVSDGRRFIYMTKGNSTYGFWMYDAYEDRWIQLPDVPSRQDSDWVTMADLEYTELGGKWVYLLWNEQGNFARYSLYTGAWEMLPSAPVDSAHPWSSNSSLVFDGSDLLYAYKARSDEMWRFDLRRQEWLPERLNGAQGYHESGSGCSAAWHMDSIYLLKGSNTTEFWRYSVARDSWVQLETIPRFGWTGKKKSVQEGGHLAGVGGGIFYALKGNKTLEFWRYGPPVGVEERARLKDGGGRVSQTICRGSLMYRPTANSSQPTAGLVDASGGKVMELKPGANDIRRLSPGVYFVHEPTADSRQLTAVRKVVIQR
jgi:hypothetical protein